MQLGTRKGFLIKLKEPVDDSQDQRPVFFIMEKMVTLTMVEYNALREREIKLHDLLASGEYFSVYIRQEETRCGAYSFPVLEVITKNDAEVEMIKEIERLQQEVFTLKREAEAKRWEQQKPKRRGWFGLLLILALAAVSCSKEKRAERDGLVCWECSVVSFPTGGNSVIKEACLPEGERPRFTDSQGNMPENWCRKK